MHSFCLQCLHTIYAQQHGTHHQGAAPDHSTDDHREREPGDQESVHSMIVHSDGEQGIYDIYCITLGCHGLHGYFNFFK